MFKKILVAVDSSRPAGRAVELAVELASQVGGKIALLHVVDSTRAFVPEAGGTDPALLAQLRRDGAAALDAASARIPSNVKYERLTAEGDPGETILAKADDWGANVIVIGSDSRGRLAHFLLGSTADAVIRRARCPVMTVRADASTGSRNSLTAATA